MITLGVTVPPVLTILPTTRVRLTPAFLVDAIEILLQSGGSAIPSDGRWLWQAYLLVVWSVRTMYRAGVDPDPNEPTATIVTTGPSRAQPKSHLRLVLRGLCGHRAYGEHGLADRSSASRNCPVVLWRHRT